MRRLPVVAVTAASLLALAGGAQAQVTDVVATTSTVGVVAITGTGLGLVSAPNGATSSTALGDTSASITGAVLTVEDASGTTYGWDVTATYADLSTADLATVASTLGLATAVNIGGAGIAVATNTDGLSTTNATLGVADTGLTKNDGAIGTPRKVLSVNGDGRGTTAFNTTYLLTLPLKTGTVATAYTGSITYTVAPQAS